MPNLLEILHQAQKELTCPTCGRSFHLSEIRPRNHINNTVMLQAICSNNHFPIVLLFIPPKAVKGSVDPITKKDIMALSQMLETDDVNFNALWPETKKTK